VYVGKKVFIKTTFGRFYTVDVEGVEDGNLFGTDKFNEPCDLAVDDIATIIPESGTKSRW